MPKFGYQDIAKIDIITGIGKQSFACQIHGNSSVEDYYLQNDLLPKKRDNTLPFFEQNKNSLYDKNDQTFC